MEEESIRLGTPDDSSAASAGQTPTPRRRLGFLGEPSDAPSEHAGGEEGGVVDAPWLPAEGAAGPDPATMGDGAPLPRAEGGAAALGADPERFALSESESELRPALGAPGAPGGGGGGGSWLMAGLQRRDEFRARKGLGRRAGAGAAVAKGAGGASGDGGAVVGEESPGFKMLKRMGWTGAGGLGAEGQGRDTPVLPLVRSALLGLGAADPPVGEAATALAPRESRKERRAREREERAAGGAGRGDGGQGQGGQGEVRADDREKKVRSKVEDAWKPTEEQESWSAMLVRPRPRPRRRAARAAAPQPAAARAEANGSNDPSARAEANGSDGPSARRCRRSRCCGRRRAPAARRARADRPARGPTARARARAARAARRARARGARRWRTSRAWSSRIAGCSRCTRSPPCSRATARHSRSPPPSPYCCPYPCPYCTLPPPCSRATARHSRSPPRPARRPARAATPRVGCPCGPRRAGDAAGCSAVLSLSGGGARAQREMGSLRGWIAQHGKPPPPPPIVLGGHAASLTPY